MSPRQSWILVLALGCAGWTLSVEAIDYESLRPKIGEILQEAGVPGASIAVVRQEQIVWAAGIGRVQSNREAQVTPHTRFQAASISKPVAAFGALRLVHLEKLSLDASVRRFLVRGSVRGADSITLRQLLSHSSGLSVHGFGGYPAGERLPTLDQILAGRPPANSGPIEPKFPRGAFKYSGGGYCVVQQLIVDATDQPFPAALEQLVLAPLKMDDSTYAQPLSKELADDAAVAHDNRSRPLNGRWHVYPEMAAAGLWTTATDLAKFILAVQFAYSNDKSEFLSRELARDMLRAQSSNGPGLGLFVHGDDQDGGFSHGGSNQGFRCKLSATKRLGAGIVIMTNSENGERVFTRIERLLQGE